MGHFFRARNLVWATLLLSGTAFAQSPHEGQIEPMQVAALDGIDTDTGGNAPPPCGRDGMCNIGACSADPDCTDLGIPQTDNPPPPPPRIDDCTGTQAAEIDAARDFGAANWSGLEKALEDFYSWPVNVKGCLEARFKDNGKVVCESSSKGMCNGNSGWASYLNRKCHLCPSFLTKISTLSSENRKACYFALITHEWGHTCERGHKTLEIFDNVAFDFYKSLNPQVTISLGSCGMD